MRDIPTKSPGSQLFSDEFNDITAELKNLITSTGITLSASDLQQIAKSVAGYVADGDFYFDTGAVNAYVVNRLDSKLPPVGYTAGMRVRFATLINNTGPSTINVASIGVATVSDTYGNPLVGGEIQATAEVTLLYDGVGFRVVSSSTSVIAAKMTKKFVNCILANNTTDPNKDIDFGAGSFRSNASPNVFTLASTLIKQVDAVWAAGTNQGGRASAVALTPSSWLHCFYIATSAGLVDCGYDTSIVAANLLTDAVGYTHYARRLSIYIDSGSNISAFYHINNEVSWNPPPFFASSAPASPTNLTLPTPPDVVTEAQIKLTASQLNTLTTRIDIVSNLAPAYIRGEVNAGIGEAGAAGSHASVNTFSVLADTNSQIQHSYSGTAPVSYLLKVDSWKELYN